MIYRLYELVRFLGLKDGLFEQPGNGSPEGTVGADHDQTLSQFTTGSTSMKFPLSQNSTERFSKDLKRAARLHTDAGKLSVDTGFALCKPYVDLTQVLPLNHAFDSGASVVPLQLWDGNAESDLAIRPYARLSRGPGCKWFSHRVVGRLQCPKPCSAAGAWGAAGHHTGHCSSSAHACGAPSS